MAAIKQIMPAPDGWYRVVGSKGSPEFEKVVFWAVVSDEDGDVVVGVPREDIGVFGAEESWSRDVAGYINASSPELLSYEMNPQLLEKFGLVWEE